MRWIVLGCLALLPACVNTQPVDNPSSPNSFQPASQDRSEARALERAEADCAGQGKHAVAKRVEGDTVYSCQ